VNRRSLLAATGTTVAGLAGCLGSGSDGNGNGGAGSGTTTTTTTTETSTTDTTTTPTDEPFRTVAVGDPDAVAFHDTHRPHAVDVVNDAGTREIAIALRDGPDAAFEETVAFPAGGRFRLRLIEPVDRELVVDPPRTDPTRVPLSGTYVDCNCSKTTVTVAADGSVRHETVSTLVACPPPTIADRSFHAGDGECAGGDAGDAAIAFADGTVTVTGSLRTPTPCYGGVLEAASIEETTLRIVVAATDPGDGACIECVGRVPYEAAVALDHDYPDAVVVEHVVGDRRREVARASP